MWDEARRGYVTEHGGVWGPETTRQLMGMSAPEWSQVLAGLLTAPVNGSVIAADVGDRVLAAYRDHLPLFRGAREAVRSLARAWPLALASSSNRPVTDAVLEVSGPGPFFRAVVSSEEVPRGKPAPDVYLEDGARLGEAVTACAAVEDSTNGIRAAKAAGARVVAVPNCPYRPDPDALSAADVVVEGIEDVTPRPDRVALLDHPRRRPSV